MTLISFFHIKIYLVIVFCGLKKNYHIDIDFIIAELECYRRLIFVFLLERFFVFTRIQ